MSLSMKLNSYKVHGRIDTREINNGRKGEKGEVKNIMGSEG